MASDDCVIGFTGSRVLDARARNAVLPTLLELDGFAFVTGGAVGVDAFIGEHLARAYPNASHRVMVPANRMQVDAWWTRGANLYPTGLTFVELEPGSTYRDRNAAIVAACTELRAYPQFTEHDSRSARSGTWQTVRLARQAKVPVSVLILAPTDRGLSARFHSGDGG